MPPQRSQVRHGTGAFATHWSGDDTAPRHVAHEASDAVQREELEETLNDIVDLAMNDMKRSLEREESMAAAEPQDAAELLRLKMKYKYKYKYKYRTQHDMEEELVDDIWGIQTMEASELETGAVEDPMADPNATMEFAFGPDNLTLKDVQEKRKEAKFELNITWRNLAAPPKADDEPGLASPGASRLAMSEQRDELMPVARWLKKLVARLDELIVTMTEVNDVEMKKLRSASRGMQSAPLAKEEQEQVAADETQQKIQDALVALDETEINQNNLMHTTKVYNVVNSLRKKLNMKPLGAKTEEENEEPVDPKMLPVHASNDPYLMDGDWNKSILCSEGDWQDPCPSPAKTRQAYEDKRKATIGKQNKTFKEYRADPWERQMMAKASH